MTFSLGSDGALNVLVIMLLLGSITRLQECNVDVSLLSYSGVTRQ